MKILPSLISRLGLVSVIGLVCPVSAFSQAAPAPARPAAPAAVPAKPVAVADDDDGEAPAAAPAAAPAKTNGSALNEKAAAELLKSLEALSGQLGAAKSKSTATALAAFQDALTADDKAYALFMKCLEKVEFIDKGKTGSEFNLWKREDATKELHEAEHKQVLKLQLQWLVLSIQAGNAASETEFSKVVSQVPAFLDALGDAWKKMKTMRGRLNADVIGTVFGRFYKLDITLARREGWSYNPLSIDSIYDTVVLPYLRAQKKANDVAGSWKKRIQMLTDVHEIEEREGKNDPNSKGEENNLKFQQEKLPRLEWGMYKDGFLMGGEMSAATSMVNHIRTHLGHKDAGLWIEELTKLANHEDVGPSIVEGSTGEQTQGNRSRGTQGPQRRK